MKKNITLNIISFLAIIIMSACGSYSDITKRQYTKGYYVSHTKSKHKAVAVVKEKKINHPKIGEVVISKPLNEVTKENFATAASIENPTADTKTLVASSSKKPIVFNTHIVSKQPLKSSPTFKIFPTKENKHSIFRKKSMVMHDGDGLSLFWIVIVVLIVLWALGLLGGGFGLGAFINILLLIALILLILWLLRII